MLRKVLSVSGVILLLFMLQNCAQKPEEGLLQRYFDAISLNDVKTLSSMALDPITWEVVKWDIVSVGEERVDPTILPEMDMDEQDLKSEVQDHVDPTIEADDALWVTQEKLRKARTRAARAAAQKEVDEAQAKYDEVREVHRQLQKAYNDARAAAAREEEATFLSLGVGELPNMRELTGDVHSKDVEIMVESKAGIKNYNFKLRQYTVKDENLNMTYRGRWIIVAIEPLN